MQIRITNCEDPDQNAPLGAVLKEQSDLVLHCLPTVWNLRSLGSEGQRKTVFSGS